MLKVNKKAKKLNTPIEISAEEVEEAELQAEIKAVMEIKNNRIKASLSQPIEETQDITDNNTNASTTTYNKNGLIMANQNMLVSTLPFLETLQVCEYSVDHEDENEDLEREVSRNLFIIICNLFLLADRVYIYLLTLML